MSKMRMFVLLVIFLTPGSRAFSKAQDCKEGGVEFQCQKKKCYMTEVATRVSDSQKNVIINYPEDEVLNNLEFKVDGVCPKALDHTAYKTGSTTIACNLKVAHYGTVPFFCKVSGFKCSPRSKTNHTTTHHGFNITISNIGLSDEGVFWCGSIKKGRVSQKDVPASLQKIFLSVEDITFFKRSWRAGQDNSYFCNYEKISHVESNSKFICKGEDPNTCRTVTSTSAGKDHRFSMMDETERKNITVTVRELEESDSGTYWCGIENVKGKHGHVFISKLSLTVVQSSTTTFPPVETTAAHNNSPVLITVIICVAVLLVMLFLFVLALILFYKRFSKSKNALAEKTKENYIYEEINERPLMPGSGSAVTTIYATADLPTMQSDSLHYASINVPRRSDEAADSGINKQESCEYSTVNFKQSARSPSPSS